MRQMIFQKDPIPVTDLVATAGNDSDGAIITFIGQARDKSRDKGVSHLEYEIYEEMASSEMKKIIDDSYDQWPITDCVVVHRYGTVNIGETSIFIAVSSPHRDDAFKACRYIIDTIKKTVPIWKKEFYSDGSQWISDRS